MAITTPAVRSRITDILTALAEPRIQRDIRAALGAYLAGGTSAEDLHALVGAPNGRGSNLSQDLATQFYARSITEPLDAPETLDVVDERTIAYFVAADALVTLYRAANHPAIVAGERRILLACDELRARGATRAAIATQLAQATYLLSEVGAGPSATGRALLTLYADDLDAIGEAAPTPRAACDVVALLAQARPDNLDLIWSLAPLAIKEWPNICISVMLRVDPARAIPWASGLIATPGVMEGWRRKQSLESLLKHTPVAGVAVAVARETNPRYSWDPARWDAEANVYALESAFAFDPDAYLWLAEECAVGPVDPVAKRAVELLATVDFARAAPALRRCVTEGVSKYAPTEALAVLLDLEWWGRDAFAIARLDARSRPLRETAAHWLERQDERVLLGVAAYLDHADAKVRALAAQVIGRVGGGEALGLLRARLAKESNTAAREAITVAIQVAEARLPLAPGARSVIAEAETALARAKTFGANWFDVEQAPPLRWKDGQPVAPIVVHYLMYTLARRSTAITAMDPRVAVIVADTIDHA
ncbi:MAG TPA: HEAT repeat domain-containing protein, partial [Ktedonobacterales bacterium]|nr:HEAT repeat domain-containing protein [Ktedonobacterales bacterium]